jgi:hypothetical protein
MAELIVRMELKNYSPRGFGMSWVADITGICYEDRTSFEYLKNGFNKTSNYFLRDGHVYKIHEPKHATRAKRMLGTERRVLRSGGKGTYCVESARGPEDEAEL